MSEAPRPWAGRALRWIRRVIAVTVSLLAVVGAVRLCVPATAGPAAEPPGVRQQLAFLRAELDDGAGADAQRLFPEGYFFLHALYGLCWLELGRRDRTAHLGVAVREARWALDRLESPAGRAPFSPDLAPAYGIFFRGWTNWLRGAILSVQPGDPVQTQRFAEDSAALGAAFDATTSPFLPAYPGQAWPVDSTVAVASLRLHDRLLPARFTGTVERWLGQTRAHLDPRTGLIPHRVDSATGDPLDGARGSSQSLILRFLVDVDPAFAREQYLRFRDRYVVRPLGLGPAVREFPDGVRGAADVDSGPLPLGVSFSATVVTIGTAQVNGDARLAAALANVVEVGGVPVATPWTKRYGFGLLPIGDAFLAWSKAARPWLADDGKGTPAGISPLWRIPLLSLLLIIATAPWLPALVRRYRARRAPGAEINRAPDAGITGRVGR
jgi:hypothetical protein